jgi:hypothetical protein
MTTRRFLKVNQTSVAPTFDRRFTNVEGAGNLLGGVRVCHVYLSIWKKSI